MEENRSFEQANAVLYAPGLRQPLRRVRPFLNGLSESGMKVIAVEPDGVFSRRTLDHEFREQIGQWPLIQLTKANNLYRSLLDSEVERANVIGYCEGGVTSTILASLHPEAVGQLILVNPAGITQEESPDRLVGRFKDKNKQYTSEIVQDFIHGRADQSTYRMMWANMNRVLGMKALASLSQVHMVDTLKSLAENGMQVSLIHGYKDRLYPYIDVNTYVPVEIHAHASFSNPSIGHGVLETHPEEALRAVRQLLSL